ncbi:MAG TPA: MarR family transcriptional regulator [Candidatus Choladousia intestinavium]|uniref:MarR family transcriptional regulator n=1 Tax=Candidatus Choladousia intestinavium TaxID=2840727 RepID=A0A9D1AAD0_9FIRM|nr:MarR family transcriptional regulator [Candidatus Choladousia intestinavium]
MKHYLKEIRRIMLASVRMDGAYYFFSKRMGIKENILNLLYALDDGKPHSQQQICQDWLIPKTTVNTNVKELAAAGYLSLVPGRDRRRKDLILTEKGMAYTAEILKDIYAAEQTAIEKTIEKYSPEFVEALDYFSDCICRELQTQKISDKKE